MSKLRVAIATKFPYIDSDAYSGLLQVSKNLCDALARRDDVELHVVSGSQHVKQIEQKRFEKYEATYFPYGSDLFYYGSFYSIASYKMKRELLRFQPDIVHCQAVADTAVGSLLTGVPVVATIHGIASAELATARSLKVKLAYRVQALVENWYVPRFTDVISCSPYITKFVRANNHKAKLYEISNPMDPTFFEVDIEQTNPQPRSILLLGAISYRKGHDLMIDALTELVDDYPDLHLTVVGKEVDPEFATLVKQRIESNGIENHVDWLGAVSQDRLLNEMKRHQIVCLPSREDTLPMALSQAMIIGNIPVASDAGGIPQMIKHGESGFLFPNGDAKALAHTLANVFSLSTSEISAMRQQNRGYANRTYHPNSVAEQTVVVYREILDHAKSRQ